jgi:hypothetical protein
MPLGAISALPRFVVQVIQKVDRPYLSGLPQGGHTGPPLQKSSPVEAEFPEISELYPGRGQGGLEMRT